MTERVLPLADGASACPFVAFEDDRDERATVPYHRHRCYAEPHPTPRALAHQEAYCLSSAFPVCPIFQDWARREAARARADTARSDLARTDADVAGAAAAAAGAASGGAGAALGAGAGAGVDDPGQADPRQGDLDAGRASDTDRGGDAIHRNPPRDWAAPPPWLASRAGRPAGADAEPPDFLGHRTADPGRGLAGSAADRLAGGPPPADEDDAPWTASASSAAAGRAALGVTGAGAVAGTARAAAGGGVARGRNASEPAIEDLDLEEEDEEPRRSVRRPRAYGQHLGGTAGPDWERPRRQDAYPTIKTRVGLPDVPRIVLMAGLVVVLAVALYFLPAVLGVGSGGGSPGAGSPGPSSAAQKTPGPSSTEPPAPTPGVYTIKKGETLSKIAKAHGITIEELLAANPTIKNADKISEGQQIILPVPSEAPPTEINSSPEPSAP